VHLLKEATPKHKLCAVRTRKRVSNCRKPNQDTYRKEESKKNCKKNLEQKAEREESKKTNRQTEMAATTKTVPEKRTDR